ncbi:MAG: chemotaxis protein CheD [Fibrobacteres bacterium]|nr:chemotaxis protein CheD [Fibrobacterota bacterium]
MNVTVGISEMRVSADPAETLITYSLGSCVGLALYDSVARVGGLIHSMLPFSKIDPDKAKRLPCMFVDTGVPALLQAMFDLGAQKKSLIAKVAGGSQIMDEKGIFNIGERNYAVLRKLLWKNNILVSGEDVGGSVPRTMYLRMETGKTILKVSGREVEI